MSDEPSQPDLIAHGPCSAFSTQDCMGGGTSTDVNGTGQHTTSKTGKHKVCGAMEIEPLGPDNIPKASRCSNRQSSRIKCAKIHPSYLESWTHIAWIQAACTKSLEYESIYVKKTRTMAAIGYLQFCQMFKVV